MLPEKIYAVQPESLHAAIDALGKLAPKASERESLIPSWYYKRHASSIPQINVVQVLRGGGGGGGGWNRLPGPEPKLLLSWL